jgi:ribosome-binding factor A
MSRRTERIADLLRAELANLLLRDVSDPRVSLTSVVAVTVTPDLRHAQVRVSVLGDEAHREESLAGLRHARGYLRTQIAHRLRLRVAPDLNFELDRGAEHSQRISDLLEGLHADDGS